MNKTIITGFLTGMLLYTVTSCRLHPKTSPADKVDEPHIKLSSSSFKADPRAMKLVMLVKSIGSSEQVDGGAVGYGGVRTALYETYLEMARLATEEELIHLTRQKRTAVKVYAFLALCERGSAACKSIFKEHLYDCTRFHYRSGCVGTDEYVNNFFLEFVRELMSKEEYDQYKQNIRKQLPHMIEWW